MAYERWTLGTATGWASRNGSQLTVRVAGVVTPGAYEALHRRLARHRARHRVLQLGDEALLAVTSRSAVEAALRGTPANQVGLDHAVLIAVPGRRLRWALHHCAHQ